MSNNSYRMWAALVVALFGFCACGTGRTTLYAWHGYDDVAYDYSKSRSPEATARLMTTYERMIDRPQGQRGVVAPGIYAEYGYLLIKQGKREQGLALMQKEIEFYPESKVFVSRIIKQLQSKKP